MEDRIRAAAGGEVDAFVDTFGGGFVEMADQRLGVAPARVNTIIDFPGMAKFVGRFDSNGAAASAGVLRELAKLVSTGRREVPIAKVYPLTKVREAYEDLAKRHMRGKIVLRPQRSFLKDTPGLP